MSGKVSRLPGRLQPDDMHPLRSWPISMSHRMQKIAKEESNKLKELESQEKSTPTMQQKSSCPTRSTKSREMACVFESIKIIPKQLKGTFHCVQSQCGQLTLSVSKTADSLNGGRTPLDLHCARSGSEEHLGALEFRFIAAKVPFLAQKSTQKGFSFQKQPKR